MEGSRRAPPPATHPQVPPALHLRAEARVVRGAGVGREARSPSGGLSRNSLREQAEDAALRRRDGGVIRQVRLAHPRHLLAERRVLEDVPGLGAPLQPGARSTSR